MKYRGTEAVFKRGTITLLKKSNLYLCFWQDFHPTVCLVLFFVRFFFFFATLIFLRVIFFANIKVCIIRIYIFARKKKKYVLRLKQNSETLK